MSSIPAMMRSLELVQTCPSAFMKSKTKRASRNRKFPVDVSNRRNYLKNVLGHSGELEAS
jgi:hypothetical protein